MYKIVNVQTITGQTIQYILRLEDNASIPIDPANTDYQIFKQQINDETAQLEDADGNVMSPEAAKDYVRTLP